MLHDKNIIVGSTVASYTENQVRGKKNCLSSIKIYNNIKIFYERLSFSYWRWCYVFLTINTLVVFIYKEFVCCNMRMMMTSCLIASHVNQWVKSKFLISWWNLMLSFFFFCRKFKNKFILLCFNEKINK